MRPVRVFMGFGVLHYLPGCVLDDGLWGPEVISPEAHTQAVEAAFREAWRCAEDGATDADRAWDNSAARSALGGSDV